MTFIEKDEADVICPVLIMSLGITEDSIHLTFSCGW